MLKKCDLDQWKCGSSECTGNHPEGMYVHSRCHPDSPTWAYYKDGKINIICAEPNCNNLIAAIEVAA